MQPRIPDGSLCIFREGVTGSREGRLVLVEALGRGANDRYTVKRYHSVKTQAADGSWAHGRITLEPLNPEFEAWDLIPGRPFPDHRGVRARARLSLVRLSMVRLSLRSRLACVVFAALAILGVYGFLHERLYAEHLWTARAAARLAAYALVYWTLAGAILWLRPAWLVPVVGAAAFIYSAWWCAEFFDPLRPSRWIYFLGSAFLLGCLFLKNAAKNAGGILALLLGLAIWMFAISIAVHFPVNTPLVYGIAFALPYLATAVLARSDAARGRGWLAISSRHSRRE